jgi:hypothetical protein
VAGPNTCQTMCDVSRGINDRDRPSEGQVSRDQGIISISDIGKSGIGNLGGMCMCITNPETPMRGLVAVT